LAAAWGNEAFGNYAPREEVRVAAACHDIGWFEWERSPAFNPATGRPYSFLDLPTSEHVKIWRSTGMLLLAQGRYPALLASLHGTGLYERLHDYSRDTPEEVEMVKRYLVEERGFQEKLLASLRADPGYAAHATPEAVGRNRRLLATWDAMSLVLCFGRGETQVFREVPTATGTEKVALSPLRGGPGRIGVDPWPFRGESLEVRCDGRRMEGRFASEEEMRAALATAPCVALSITLEKGEERTK